MGSDSTAAVSRRSSRPNSRAKRRSASSSAVSRNSKAIRSISRSCRPMTTTLHLAGNAAGRCISSVRFRGSKCTPGCSSSIARAAIAWKPGSSRARARQGSPECKVRARAAPCDVANAAKPMLSAPRDARLHLQTDIQTERPANPNDAAPRTFPLARSAGPPGRRAWVPCVDLYFPAAPTPDCPAVGSE